FSSGSTLRQTGHLETVNRPGEITVREIAGDCIENARPDRGIAHAEVVTVEDVVGRDIIESACGGFITAGQDAPDHEIDDQPSDRTEELANFHELTRLVRLFDHWVLAVSLHRRSGCCPDEVWTTDARVPEVSEPGVDVVPHLVEDAVVPARTCGFGALLADEPDGGRQ